MALIFNGAIIALVVVNVLVGANQLEHHVLRPLPMGKVLRIHGLAIVLTIAVGTTLPAIAGALLAVRLPASAGTSARYGRTGRASDAAA